MTLPGANIIGKTVRNSGNNYWLGSTYSFGSDYTHERRMNSSGSLGYYDIGLAFGVRGVVSIRTGVKVVYYDEADVSVAHPYIIE